MPIALTSMLPCFGRFLFNFFGDLLSSPRASGADVNEKNVLPTFSLEPVSDAFDQGNLDLRCDFRLEEDAEGLSTSEGSVSVLSTDVVVDGSW